MRSTMKDMLIKLLVLFVPYGLASTEDDKPQSVCLTEEFTARCRSNEVVIMTSALYGRMQLGRCVDRNYGFIGCQADVLVQADGLCSGRRTCVVGVPSAAFELVPTECPKDLKLYLEASYRCLPVVSPSDLLCSPSSGSLRLTSPSGYISNVFTEETELGSVKCPWSIQAGKGQRINVTLLDFGTATGQGDPSESGKTCQAYATVSERQTSRSATVCSGAERQRHVFLSEQEQLEVRIQHGLSRNRTRNFLLKYEFVGCPDPESSDRSIWMKRQTPNQLDIGCTMSERRWTLVCVGNRWTGPTGNCSTDQGLVDNFEEMRLTKSSLPWGASIIAVSVIALTLAVVILVAGLMILRCHRRSRLSDSLPENVYYGETTKRQITIGLPVSVSEYRPESVHRSNLENEYSYIGEMLDSAAASSAAPGRRSHDYGTTEARCERLPPQYDSPCSAGEVEKTGLFRPSAYFELEPGVGLPRRAVDLVDHRCYRLQDEGPPAESGENRYEGKAGTPGSASSVYFNGECKELADNYKSV